jgi:hypothetical protein
MKGEDFSPQPSEYERLVLVFEIWMRQPSVYFDKLLAGGGISWPTQYITLR